MSGSNPAPYETHETWEFSYELEGKLNIYLVDSEYDLERADVDQPTFVRSIAAIDNEPLVEWAATYKYADLSGEMKFIDLYYDRVARKWAILGRFECEATYEKENKLHYPNLYAAITAYSDLLGLAFSPMDLCTYRAMRLEHDATDEAPVKPALPPRPEQFGAWA